MKKFLLFSLLSTSSLICAQQIQLNGGYPFKHNGNTCFFYPVNGIPAQIGQKPADGFARCFVIENYPARVKRVAQRRQKDSFSVEYATADKGKQKAQYAVEFSL